MIYNITTQTKLLEEKIIAGYDMWLRLREMRNIRSNITLILWSQYTY